LNIDPLGVRSSVDESVDHGGGDDVVAEHFAPAAEHCDFQLARRG
jgi:hypothetical protein